MTVKNYLSWTNALFHLKLPLKSKSVADYNVYGRSSTVYPVAKTSSSQTFLYSSPLFNIPHIIMAPRQRKNTSGFDTPRNTRRVCLQLALQVLVSGSERLPVAYARGGFGGQKILKEMKTSLSGTNRRFSYRDCRNCSHVFLCYPTCL